MIRKSQVAVAIAALIAAPAFAAVGFDANVELDSSYQGNDRGLSQTGPHPIPHPDVRSKIPTTGQTGGR